MRPLIGLREYSRPSDAVPDRDPPAADDVRSQAGAVDHAPQHAALGQRREVRAGLAPLLADALHVADGEALADEVVEANAAGEHLAAGGGGGELDARLRQQ